MTLFYVKRDGIFTKIVLYSKCIVHVRLNKFLALLFEHKRIAPLTGRLFYFIEFIHSAVGTLVCPFLLGFLNLFTNFNSFPLNMSKN